MRWIKKLSEYFNTREGLLEEYGVYDRVLGIDAKLFIDPFLFDSLNIPEFIWAREKIKDRFRKVAKLLYYSQENNDSQFKAAVKLLTCPETKWIGIWYGAETDDWNSIWKKLATRLALAWKKIINLGIQDPEIFELLWLFEEDYWADRLSDITIDTLHEEFLSFTHRVSSELSIDKLAPITFKGKVYSLPWVEEDWRYILFLPKDGLRDLPMAQDKQNIEHVAEFNNELRSRLNDFVGDDWKEYLEKKENREREFFVSKDYIEEVVEHYKCRQPEPYDYAKDPKWEIDWVTKWKTAAMNNPLELHLSDNPGIEEIKVVVRKIIEKYKKSIEHNWTDEILRKWNWRCSERYAQKIFFAIADSYCDANNLDLSPESKASTWPVDFKLSRWDLKVVVEIKLTSNDIIKWITKQLPEYTKWENAEWIFLIILSWEHEYKIDQLRKLEEEYISNEDLFPEYHVVDGRKKPTPSNL